MIIAVQMHTLQEVIQMEGRARRRMSHAAYDRAQRDIERVTVIPRAVVTVKAEQGGAKKGGRGKGGHGCSRKKKADCIAGDLAKCMWINGKCKSAATATPDTVAETKAAPDRVETRRTCYHVFAEAVEAERSKYESVMRALYLVSYGRDAFWNMRPSFVERGRADATEDATVRQRVIGHLKAGANRAAVVTMAAAKAGLDAWRYDASADTG